MHAYKHSFVQNNFTEPNLCQVIFLAAGDVAGKQTNILAPVLQEGPGQTEQ